MKKICVAIISFLVFSPLFAQKDWTFQLTIGDHPPSAQESQNPTPNPVQQTTLLQQLSNGTTVVAINLFEEARANLRIHNLQPPSSSPEAVFQLKNNFWQFLPRSTDILASNGTNELLLRTFSACLNQVLSGLLRPSVTYKV